ncbi:MAG: FAD-dependent oxidoreductase [Trueperaceae bacterium]|nr:FAD-dependent oxidoreductase [Trueperaceae bacterium]
MSTLVLGAGMAGLSAAKTLKDAGEDVIVLEAKDRIGGRTFTNRTFADHPVEFGAEFIHGDKVALWSIVNELGLKTLHWQKTLDSLVHMEEGNWLSMSEARSRHPEFDITRSWLLPDVDPLPNEDWQSYLSRIGFDEKQLRYVRRSFANACGEGMRFLSASAVIRGLRSTLEQNGDGDYRILSGYDAIVNHLAQGLEIYLNDPILSVDWSGSGVSVQSLDGEKYEADSAIIALPLGVLLADGIKFQPGLPRHKQNALRGLRMGPVIKLVYKLTMPLAAKEVMAIYASSNPPMWWSPSFGHNTNENVWTAFVSGDWAMDLLVKGEEGALESALSSLKKELGLPELEASESHLQNWPDDPYTRGGYSFVLPGHHGAREKLAEPTPPLFWAGEACAQEHQAATVHGALETGLRAAHEVLNHNKIPAPIATKLRSKPKSPA